MVDTERSGTGVDEKRRVWERVCTIEHFYGFLAWYGLRLRLAQ